VEFAMFKRIPVAVDGSHHSHHSHQAMVLALRAADDDLIVMASRGHGAVAGALPGSRTQRVLSVSVRRIHLASRVGRGGFNPDRLTGVVLFDGADGVGKPFPIFKRVDEPTDVPVLQHCVVGFGDRIAAAPDGVVRLGGEKGFGQASRRDRKEDHSYERWSGNLGHVACHL
jgi:hypothetical protein